MRRLNPREGVSVPRPYEALRRFSLLEPIGLPVEQFHQIGSRPLYVVPDQCNRLIDSLFSAKG